MNGYILNLIFLLKKSNESLLACSFSPSHTLYFVARSLKSLTHFSNVLYECGSIQFVTLCCIFSDPFSLQMCGLSCGHLFCAPCWSRNFQVTIDKPGVLLKCMQPACDCVVSVEFLAKYLPQGDENKKHLEVMQCE